MALRIVIPASSEFDDVKNEFIDHEEQVLTIEHSLWSMSRWEERYKEAFLSAELTDEKLEYYIYCMSEEYIPVETRRYLMQNFKKEILGYILDDRTAKKRKRSGNAQQSQQSSNSRKEYLPTGELYYIMFERGLPLTCEKWHLSRLVDLLKVYADHEKKSKGKGKGKGKMSPAQMARLSQINRSRQNGG